MIVIVMAFIVILALAGCGVAPAGPASSPMADATATAASAIIAQALAAPVHRVTPPVATVTVLPPAPDANLKILATRPLDASALHKLAITARDQGELTLALAYTDQALAMADPANVVELKSLYRLSAELWMMQGNNDKFIAAYEQMRQVDPTDLAVLSSLINFYTNAGNDAKVVEIGQQMGTLEPGNWQNPFTVAQALARQGDAPNALFYARQALELAPEDQKPRVQEQITAIGG